MLRPYNSSYRRCEPSVGVSAAGAEPEPHYTAARRVSDASQRTTLPARSSNAAALRHASRNAAATATSAASPSNRRPYASAYSVMPWRASSSSNAVRSLNAAMRCTSSASGSTSGVRDIILKSTPGGIGHRDGGHVASAPLSWSSPPVPLSANAERGNEGRAHERGEGPRG